MSERAADTYILLQKQLESFRYDKVKSKCVDPLKKTSQLRTYSPFIHPEGVVRIRSRVVDAEYMMFEQRCPIIIPRRQYVTSLIVQAYYHKHLHQNQSVVLN